MSKKPTYRWIRLLLILLPLGMICWQLYASNFRTLTRWKGGGYGMYTDSHGSYRSIVFVPSDKDTLIHVYPLTEQIRGELNDSLKESYKKSHRILKSTIFFPDWYEERALRTEWLSREDFEKGDFFIYTTDLDIDERSIKSRMVHQLNAD